MNGMDAYGSPRGGSTLNRGQAAALLARLIRPGTAATFYTQELRPVPGRAAALTGDTVLADGGRPADVTAEDFGPQLVTSLLQWGDQSTGERLHRRPADL
jgi:hypothetical protein